MSLGFHFAEINLVDRNDYPDSSDSENGTARADMVDMDAMVLEAVSAKRIRSQSVCASQSGDRARSRSKSRRRSRGSGSHHERSRSRSRSRNPTK